MPQYNTLNVTLYGLQPNKLKAGIKIGAEVTLNLSSNVIGISNNEANFIQSNIIQLGGSIFGRLPLGMENVSKKHFFIYVASLTMKIKKYLINRNQLRYLKFLI